MAQTDEPVRDAFGIKAQVFGFEFFRRAPITH